MSQPMINDAQTLPVETAHTTAVCESSDPGMTEVIHSCVIETSECVNEVKQLESNVASESKDLDPVSEPHFDAVQKGEKKDEVVADVDNNDECQQDEEDAQEDLNHGKHTRSEDNDDSGAASKYCRVESTARESTDFADAGRAPLQCTEEELTKTNSVTASQTVADGTTDVVS